MIHNIILIILIILLFFFISNEIKINDLISKKYIKYLILLIIVYFIYQKYNFVLLAITILVIICMNIDIKDKILNNKYLTNYETFKNLIIDYHKEMFSNKESFDFEPYTKEKNNSEHSEHSQNSEINEIQNENETNKKNIEPFKTEITKLKDLYENIKLEIKKIK
jgi:peptidoglycan hydrolase CwlO-like protein